MLISREHSYREELKVRLDLCTKNHCVNNIIEKVPPVKKGICHTVYSKPRLIVDPVVLNIKSWNIMTFHPNAIVGLLSWAILRVNKLGRTKSDYKSRN